MRVKGRCATNSLKMAAHSWIGLLLMLLVVPWASAAVSEKDVLVLTIENLSKTIMDNPFIVVEFYAPWCGHCKKLAPEYAKAATELKSHDPPIVLAKLDVNSEENKPLASEYGIKGFPTIKIFKKGGGIVSDYKGPRDAAGIIAHLKQLVGPPSVEITSAKEAEELVNKSQLTVVGLFKSLEDKEYLDFMTVADELRTDYQFAHTLDSSFVPDKGVVLVAPAVRLYKCFDEGFNDAQDLSVKGLKKFLEEKSVPLVTEMNKDPTSQAFLSKFFNTVATKAYLLLDLKADTAESYRTIYGDLAKAFQPKGLKFLIADSKENDNAVKFFGIKDGGLPALVVQDKDNNRKYVVHNIEASDMPGWLQDFQDGKIEAYVKSDEIPVKNDEPVKVVVRKSLNQMVLDSGKNVLLEFYAPWCGHCKKLAPTLDALAADFKDDSDVVIAKMDATANDVPSDLFDVKGFPTLYFRTATGENIRYDGNRSKADLSKFIKKHRTTALETAGSTGEGGDAKDEL
ncbi:protein disulfide-isomerase isoform X3 [Physcomitrium patens]|uniref:protein disulfide-isomerase isoform X3 n=1 Tax=Physcomitrium patens TaxID=3218 RepID=UPI000D15576F|nr:protein disulfide-isomerase-like isoform X3 [Physcomitrium patens]|eukprot:XP_024397608.1 protein disulfide-isomerase-like isoform X3 [Physcomitrella patens]